MARFQAFRPSFTTDYAQFWPGWNTVSGGVVGGTCPQPVISMAIKAAVAITLAVKRLPMQLGVA